MMRRDRLMRFATRWPIVIALVATSADAGPAKKVRNAVLLVMPATRDAPHRDRVLRQFQPLLCSIDGKLVTGIRCADLVSAHAVIRVVGDNLTVSRAETRRGSRLDDAPDLRRHGDALPTQRGMTSHFFGAP